MPEDRKNKISCKVFTKEMEVALEVISGKWKSTILWNLHNEEVIRYNEFLRILPDITQKMLTQQLRTLEKDKLVNRKVFNSVTPVVEYSLTSLAKDVIPILSQLNLWGKQVIKAHNT